MSHLRTRTQPGTNAPSDVEAVLGMVSGHTSAMNRVALVTGGAQGIGYSIAARFVADGLRVAVADLNADGAVAVARKFGESSCSAHQVDVADDDAVFAMVTETVDRWGAIDVLVNSAGVITRCDADSTDSEQWRRDLDINLGGVMRCSRAAYSALRAGSGGSIINLGSVGTALGMPLRLAYSTAKAGIGGLTRTLAAEWGAVGIRVNAIAPGYIDTPMMRSGFDLRVLDEAQILRRTPLGRLGSAAEIASVASFLASDDASFVTGVIVAVDGGLTIAGDFRPEVDGA